MRDYGRVYATFWTSDTIGALSEDGRLLALYLMTSPHTTIAGVFRLTDGYACDDLKWTAERVAEGFRNLSDNGFADRCETTKWVWIRAHLEWNPPENPNQRKAVAKCAAAVPDKCAWRADFMRIQGAALGMVAPLHDKGSETVGEPFANQEQEQKQEQKKEKKPRARRARVSLDEFFAQCLAEDVLPIPEDDPIYAYAEKVGLPAEFLPLAWQWFKTKRRDATQAGIVGWRAHFRDAVEANWPGYWYIRDDGTYGLTTAGKQAQRAAT
jgi:hypothetical protein